MNCSFASSETIDLMSIDIMAGLIRILYKSFLKRDYEWTLSDGTCLSGQVHEAWFQNSNSVPSVYGRVLDLKSAYKQLCVSLESRKCSGLWIVEPRSGAARPFLQITLPFGARASVLGFNRVSRALWFLGTRIFNLLWTSFYDDFGMIDPCLTCSSSWSGGECLLTCLGFQFADAPHKRKSFADTFDFLGAVVDLRSFSDGLVTVSNKADRVAAISTSLRDLHEGEWVQKHILESLKGKLLFTCQNMFGMALRQATAAIKLSSRTLTYADVCLMHFAARWLETSIPRDIGCKTGPVHYLYTDGAAEPNNVSVSCGAVLFPFHDRPLTFGFRLVEAVVSKLCDGNPQRQIITQVELYPVLVARLLWSDLFLGARVWIFIDNDAARQSLIKGWSDSPSSNELLNRVALHEATHPYHVWYARVPSWSNPADAASRLRLQDVVKDFGADIVDVPDALMTCILNSGGIS